MSTNNYLKQQIEFIINNINNNNYNQNILFFGPPGLGKTYYCHYIAKEVNRELLYINCSAINDVKSLNNIIMAINDGDLLFLDEIHLLKKKYFEIFYGVLTDNKLSVVYTFEETSKVMNIPIPNFVLMIATTEIFNLPQPFIDRFTHQFCLTYYTNQEIKNLIEVECRNKKINISDILCEEIILASQSTPRLCINYLKMIKESTIKITSLYDVFGINYLGLNQFMVTYIKYLQKKIIVSLNKIAAYLGLLVKNVATKIEPILLRLDLIEITAKGRVLTIKGQNYNEKKFSIK